MTRTTRGHSGTSSPVSLVVLVIAVPRTCFTVVVIRTVAIIDVSVSGVLSQVTCLPGSDAALIRVFLLGSESLLIGISFRVGDELNSGLSMSSLSLLEDSSSPGSCSVLFRYG